MSPKILHVIALAIQICNAVGLLANTYFGVNAPLTVGIGAIGIGLASTLHALSGPPLTTPVPPVVTK